MIVFSRRALARLLVAGLSAGAATGCFRDREARIQRERTETFDLITRAQQMKAQGDFILARDLFLKAAQQSPDRPVIFYEIGNCYYQLGNREQAQAYYEKALALAPDYALAKAELDLVNQQLKVAEAAATPTPTPAPTESAKEAPPVELAQAATPTPRATEIPTPVVTATPVPTTPPPTPTPTPEETQVVATAIPSPTEVAKDRRRPVPRTPEATPQEPAAAKEALKRAQQPTITPTVSTPTPAPTQTPVQPTATPEPASATPAERDWAPTATPPPTATMKVVATETATPQPTVEPTASPEPTKEEVKPAKEEATPTPAAKRSESSKKSTTSSSPTGARRRSVRVVEEDQDAPVSGPFGGIQQAFGGLAPEKRAGEDPNATPVDPAEARKVIFPELAPGQMPTPEQDMAAAKRAEELGYYDEAVRAWSRYLNAKPDDIESRLRLAEMLQRSGRSLRAESEYDMAEKLAPGSATVAFEKGNFYVRGKDFVKANEAFTHALELEPTNLKAKNNLAAVQQQLGNFSAAERIAREVLEVDPSFASAWLNLALAQDDSGAPPTTVIQSLENYVRLSKAVDPTAEKWLADLRKRIGGVPVGARSAATAP